MNKGGFSWKRALGITRLKSNISRKIWIPLTRSGRQRKLGAASGCMLYVFIAFIMVVAIAIIIFAV